MDHEILKFQGTEKEIQQTILFSICKVVLITLYCSSSDKWNSIVDKSINVPINIHQTNIINYVVLCSYQKNRTMLSISYQLKRNINIKVGKTLNLLSLSGGVETQKNYLD
jgi:hypothetical protein